MSGPASVPLAILAIFAPTPWYIRGGFAVTAILCAAATCFAVWRRADRRVAHMQGLLVDARSRIRALTALQTALQLIYDDVPIEWSKQCAIDETGRSVLVIGAENTGATVLERCQVRLSCHPTGAVRSALSRKLGRNTVCAPFTLAAGDVRAIPILWLPPPLRGDDVSRDLCVFHYVERNGLWQDANSSLVLSHDREWIITLYAISAGTRQLERRLAVAFIDNEWTLRKIGPWDDQTSFNLSV